VRRTINPLDPDSAADDTSTIIGVDDNDNVERFVFAISDANFERYGISANLVKSVLSQHDKLVTSSLLLIASRHGEAEDLVRRNPGKVSLCLDNGQMPALFKKILTESLELY